MHSRIFQLKKEKEKEFGEIELGNFVGDIADYILPVSERDSDINWLKEYLEKYDITVDVEEKTITFNKGSKIKYFKERFSKFKKAAEEVTLEDFAGVSSLSFAKLYDVTGEIENEYGFYIYKDGEIDGEGGHLQTLDSFIRAVEEGSTYYIGTIIDYHA